MGAPCIITFDTSDCISAVGVVLSGVSIYIAVFLHQRHADKRRGKDLLLEKVKSLYTAYGNLLTHLHDGQMRPRTILNSFKLLAGQHNSLITAIPKGYKIDENKLMPYIRALPDLITESQEFIDHFDADTPFELSDRLKQELVSFHSLFGCRFSELEMEINNA